jgi:predicted transcriptional regulator
MKNKLDSKRYLFLSIHQQYAELILEGKKTVELRRRKPKVDKGDIVILYATSPTCSVLGTAEVKGIAEDSPSAIWKNSGKKAKLPKESFDAYFESSKTAVAISLKNQLRLNTPIPLVSLRKLFSDFSPPQSYRYLTEADAKRLGVKK